MIIMDHYQKPNNRVEKQVNNFMKTEPKKNCADEFWIKLEIENDVVKNGYFFGSGCAVSTASVDILLTEIKNKNKSAVLKLLEQYEEIINTGKYIEELGQLNVFDTINKIENRKSCALLGIETIKKLL